MHCIVNGWKKTQQDVCHFTHSERHSFLFSRVSVFLRSLFSIEFSVQEEDEKVDVHFGFVEHLHDGHAVILQLKEVLHIKQP